MRSRHRRTLRPTAATALLAALALPGAVGAQDGTIDLGFADLGLYGPDREVRLLRDSTSHTALGWALHTGQVTATTTGAYARVDSAGVEAGVCDLADLSTVLTRFEGYLVRVDDSGRILVGGWYTSELSGDAHLAVLVRFVPGGLCEVDTSWGGGGVQVGSERCLPGQSCRFVDVAYPAFPSGRVYALLETGLTADLSLVKAWKGDTEGNLVYRKTARNFNPMMATAGAVTVAEVEELVEAGTLDPDQIHTPGIFVQRIIRGEKYLKTIEHRTVRKRPAVA